MHRRGEGAQKAGLGFRAIRRELGMAVFSIHSILAGKKAKREPATAEAHSPLALSVLHVGFARFRIRRDGQLK
jgi:predicted trehalose synthase